LKLDQKNVVPTKSSRHTSCHPQVLAQEGRLVIVCFN
jgi:hypothetical protein